MLWNSSFVLQVIMGRSFQIGWCYLSTMSEFALSVSYAWLVLYWRCSNLLIRVITVVLLCYCDYCDDWWLYVISQYRSLNNQKEPVTYASNYPKIITNLYGWDLY